MQVVMEWAVAKEDGSHLKDKNQTYHQIEETLPWIKAINKDQVDQDQWEDLMEVNNNKDPLQCKVILWVET